MHTIYATFAALPARIGWWPAIIGGLICAAIAYGLSRRGTAPVPTIELVHGDITEQHVDAIVNAAKPSLLGGGGLDGAIHRAAGPSLLAECRALRRIAYPDGLRTGAACTTEAGNLPAKWVIHTVGPDRRIGQTDPGLLRSCYRAALAEADRMGAKSIAFPLISSGMYGWGTGDAVRQAIDALLTAATGVRQIRLVLFDAESLEIARSYARTIRATRQVR